MWTDINIPYCQKYWKYCKPVNPVKKAGSIRTWMSEFGVDDITIALHEEWSNIITITL